MEKSKRKRIVLYLVLIGGLALLVCYFDEILAFFGQVGGVSLPLALGCGIAYVLNIIMSAMERHYFTKKDAPWVAKPGGRSAWQHPFLLYWGLFFF